MNSLPHKRCTCCSQEFPDTPDFFPIYKVRGKRYHRNQCRVCWRIGRKAHSDETRGADRARRTKWRKENPEKVKAQKKRSHIRRRDHNNERTRRWVAVHKVEQSEKRKAEYAANPQPAIERALKYQREHPEYVRARANRRRVRKLNAEGDGWTTADIKLQFKSQKGLCWHCGVKLDKKYHADHLYPLAKGGRDDPRNMVISCAHCNCSKKDKPTWEWNGRLL